MTSEIVQRDEHAAAQRAIAEIAGLPEDQDRITLVADYLSNLGRTFDVARAAEKYKAAITAAREHMVGEEPDHEMAMQILTEAIR